MPDGNRSTELIASDIWNKASQISIVTKTRNLKFCFVSILNLVYC
jgi:hypothetical protein